MPRGGPEHRPIQSGFPADPEGAKRPLQVVRADPGTLKGAMFGSGGCTCLVHGDGPLNQSSRGGRGVDKPNGRLDRRRARAADPRALPVSAERPVLSAVRVFHRLPTAALVSEGIAPVDSPWKTLSGPSGTVDFLPRGGPEHRPIQSGFPGGFPKERSPSFESPAPIHGLRLGIVQPVPGRTNQYDTAVERGDVLFRYWSPRWSVLSRPRPPWAT